MSNPVNPIPEGFHTVTPYLIVAGAAEAIEFYKNAFGAVELMRLAAPGGKVGHAEIQIGNSIIMLADEMIEAGYRGAKSLGGSPIGMMLYVEDCDVVVERAVAAGATLVEPVANQFYGDRRGGIEDPYGLKWHVATHVEDVSMEEIERRAAAHKAG